MQKNKSALELLCVALRGVNSDTPKSLKLLSKCYKSLIEHMFEQHARQDKNLKVKHILKKLSKSYKAFKHPV